MYTSLTSYFRLLCYSTFQEVFPFQFSICSTSAICVFCSLEESWKCNFSGVINGFPQNSPMNKKEGREEKKKVGEEGRLS